MLTLRNLIGESIVCRMLIDSRYFGKYRERWSKDIAFGLKDCIFTDNETEESTLELVFFYRIYFNTLIRKPFNRK